MADLNQIAEDLSGLTVLEAATGVCYHPPHFLSTQRAYSTACSSARQVAFYEQIDVKKDAAAMRRTAGHYSSITRREKLVSDLASKYVVGFVGGQRC